MATLAFVALGELHGPPTKLSTSEIRSSRLVWHSISIVEKDAGLGVPRGSATFLYGRRPKTLGDFGRTIIIYSTRQNIWAALFKWLLLLSL